MAEVLSQEEIDALLTAISGSASDSSLAPLTDEAAEKVFMEVMGLLPNALAGNFRNAVARWAPDLAMRLQSTRLPLESIVHLSDRTVQDLVRKCPMNVLSLALVGASAEVRRKVESNLSKRMREALIFEIETISRGAREGDISSARDTLLAPLEQYLRDELYWRSKRQQGVDEGESNDA